jgi:hypothetical protein
MDIESQLNEWGGASAMVAQTPTEWLHSGIVGGHWAIQVQWPTPSYMERYHLDAMLMKLAQDRAEPAKHGERIGSTLYRTRHEIVDGKVNVIYFAKLH